METEAFFKIYEELTDLLILFPFPCQYLPNARNMTRKGVILGKIIFKRDFANSTKVTSLYNHLPNNGTIMDSLRSCGNSPLFPISAMSSSILSYNLSPHDRSNSYGI